MKTQDHDSFSRDDSDGQSQIDRRRPGPRIFKNKYLIPILRSPAQPERLAGVDDGPSPPPPVSVRQLTPGPNFERGLFLAVLLGTIFWALIIAGFWSAGMI